MPAEPSAKVLSKWSHNTADSWCTKHGKHTQSTQKPELHSPIMRGILCWIVCCIVCLFCHFRIWRLVLMLNLKHPTGWGIQQAQQQCTSFNCNHCSFPIWRWNHHFKPQWFHPIRIWFFPFFRTSNNSRGAHTSDWHLRKSTHQFAHECIGAWKNSPQCSVHSSPKSMNPKLPWVNVLVIKLNLKIQCPNDTVHNNYIHTSRLATLALSTDQKQNQIQSHY